MIDIQDVTKKFGRHTAVHPLTLSVPQGSITGLLGHNGAGKSTLIGMLLGQVYPDHGRVTIDGADVFRRRGQALARVGAIFETPGFYPYLSGWRNLQIFCEYSNTARPADLDEAVRIVRLQDRIHEPVRTYSCGMRQRLALAQALVPDPAVLILDEPGSGLDPEGYHDLRSVLQQLNEERGLTILISSHILAEVEQICSHIAIIHRGRLLFSGARGEWALSDRKLELALEDGAWPGPVLIEQGLAISADETRGTVRLANGVQPADVAERLMAAGHRLRTLRLAPPTLEEFYLHTIHPGDEPSS